MCIKEGVCASVQSIVVSINLTSHCMRSLLLGDGLDEPLHALLETFMLVFRLTLRGDGGARLDGPCAVLNLH